MQARNESAVAALLFDLGGVVIGLDFDRTFRFWATRAGCSVEAIRERFRFDDAYERHERGELDALGFFDALRTSLGIDISDAEFLAGWNDIYLDPIQGIAALLEAASGRLSLFAFTNSNPSHQEVWSHRLEALLPHFRSVYVSSELGLRKPDPKAFLRVAELAGFRPEQFVFFDDSPENVAGAEAAGMRGVLVGSNEDVRTVLIEIGVAASDT